LASFVVTYFNLISALFSGQEPFPLILASDALAALSFGFVGVFIFLLSRTASDDEPLFLQRLNLILRYTTIIMLITGLFWVLHQPSVGHTHPIELLIHEAGKNHDVWLKAAKESTTLAEAVQQYQQKYNLFPPP
jgi:hypothetical protein